MPFTWRSTNPGASTTSPRSVSPGGGSAAPVAATTPSAMVSQPPAAVASVSLGTRWATQLEAEASKTDERPGHAPGDRCARRPQLHHRHRHLRGAEATVLGPDDQLGVEEVGTRPARPHR